ncbi:MAG: class I SAM-dependent methyltransferase [Candidatus Omnitrophota bacterium]
MRGFFNKIFIRPDVRNLDIDSREAISIHRRIIKKSPLLTEHYNFIYRYFKKIEDSLEYLNFPSLEIGSGGGFLKEFLPNVITSDIVESEGIDRVEDVTCLSFPDNSLKAIYANGVLHHIEDPGKCLEEIQRVLVSDGIFVCNEPSSSSFGYFMNKNFHNEYTNKLLKRWKIEDKTIEGRLTKVNMALPYIIFKRDAYIFTQRFKRLKIISFIYHDFLRYTLSGGLTYKPFVPHFLYGVVNFIEFIFRPLMQLFGNNMIVTIKKI